MFTYAELPKKLACILIKAKFKLFIQSMSSYPVYKYLCVHEYVEYSEFYHGEGTFTDCKIQQQTGLGANMFQYPREYRHISTITFGFLITRI